MDTKKIYIVVLWDGSAQSENAFRHALLMVTKSSYTILLLRVMKKRRLFESKLTFGTEVVNEREVMNATALELQDRYGVLPEYAIKMGNFKKSIREILTDFECSVIISPEENSIHKGIAVNIIKEFSNYGAINVPILIANNAPKSKHTIIEIVIPIEYQPEFKDAIDWVVFLARKYSCNINFIKPMLSDGEPKKALLNNIYFTKQVLDDNDIVYGIKTASKLNNFVDEIYNFANNIEADYILSTSLNYNLFRKNSMYNDVPFIWINPRKRIYRNFN